MWLGSNAREGTHVVPCKIMEDFDQMMPELPSPSSQNMEESRVNSRAHQSNEYACEEEEEE
jgi:hypothetical protein